MSPAFLLTSLVIVATPGTGALLTISAGISRGTRASLTSAFGCTLGTVPHLAAALTGAAALLQAIGRAFMVVKLLGVGYLLYMAWSTWRETGTLAADETMTPRSPRSPWRVVAAAVMANLLNPKLSIFFLAFLPQFVSSSDPHPVLHMLELSAVFMLMTFVVFAVYGGFASAMRTHLVERPQIMQRMRRAFAVSFVGLSAKLAVTQR